MLSILTFQQIDTPCNRFYIILNTKQTLPAAAQFANQSLLLSFITVEV